MSEEIEFVIAKEATEELLRVEPDGRVRIDDIVLKDWEELVRRINATECLSAEMAESAADYCGNTIENYEPECSALRNYANERTGTTSS